MKQEGIWNEYEEQFIENEEEEPVLEMNKLNGRPTAKDKKFLK